MAFADQIATAYAPLAVGQSAAQVAASSSWAQSFIESYCDRTFDAQTGQVELVDPINGTGLLAHLPIVQIRTVEGYLPAQSGTGMEWVTLTNYGIVKATGQIYDTTGLPGTVWNLGPSWPWLPEGLRVTYDYGYSTAPRALVDVAVRLISQAVDNPSLMVQYKVGDLEGRFSGSAGVLLNALDRAILDKYSMPGVY